jgi:hypothetical protein
VVASAGVSAWSQPVLSSRLKGRPAGGGGLALSHVHSARWRGVLLLDHSERGAAGFTWHFRTRYLEAGALVSARLFDVGPMRLSMGGGPVMAWPLEGRGRLEGPPEYLTRLDLSAQEYSARFALEAAIGHRLPISGRIVFQRGINRLLHGNPAEAEGRWDRTTPPYSKLMGFELGATLLRW